MTHEELMKPRWKIIADFPGNPVAINSILQMRNEYQFEVHSKLIILPESYPHLFQKLKWWEDRTEDDLPKFIKYRKGSGRYAVHRVMKPYPTQHPEFPAFGENFVDVDYQEESNQGKMNCEVEILTSLEMKSLRDFQPATEEEYLNQSKN